jgi:hypothetical protein
MAYLRNSIGDFNVISLQGEIDDKGEAISIDSRPGVDGMEFTLLGLKAQPFSMISLVDCDDLTAANIEMIGYKELIELNTVNVFKNGVPIMGGFLIKVLNVTCLRRDKIVTAVGNKISNQAGALLECRWDLIAVPA